MLSRLTAERSLRQVAAAQAADSALEPRDRQRTIDAWRRAADPEPARPPTQDELLASMAALGFHVVTHG